MKTETNIHKMLTALEMELVKMDGDQNRFGFNFLFAVRATLIAVRNLKKFF